MIEKLKDSDGEPIVIKSGATHKVTATLKDYADVAIVKASLLTLSMTLKSGANANIRGPVSVLDVNGGTVATNGVLTLYITASDNTISSSLAVEKRILLLTYTWNDGVDANNQTGVSEYIYTVESTSDGE